MQLIIKPPDGSVTDQTLDCTSSTCHSREVTPAALSAATLKSFTVTATQSPKAARQPVRIPGELSESRRNTCTALNSAPDFGAGSCSLSSTELFKTHWPSKRQSYAASAVRLKQKVNFGTGELVGKCRAALVHSCYTITLNPGRFNRQCMCGWMEGSVLIKKWQQMPFVAFVMLLLIRKVKFKSTQIRLAFDVNTT